MRYNGINLSDPPGLALLEPAFRYMYMVQLASFYYLAFYYKYHQLYINANN